MLGMESLRRKRKGNDFDPQRILQFEYKSAPPIVGSHLSLEECSRCTKKCKEYINVEAVVGSCSSSSSRPKAVVTAPTCRGSPGTDSPGRGLKRKVGCIESATQIGRKKKLEQEYILGPEIGQGKFGLVRICRSKVTGVEFACKTLPKNGEESVHKEIEIMQHLSGHSSVVTLKAVCEDSESIHLVMELCSGGRLVDEMVREGLYTEYRAAHLLKDLVSVIKYCHDMGVVHRDIKPENILLTASRKMKLADFGLAVRVSSGQKLFGVAGSPAYVAPEVLVGHYSEKVDIWGAGVLLHALLAGVLPFQGDSLEAVFEAIKTAKLDFCSGIWESISGPARDLLGRMLTRDVLTRISADEILRHPWIMFYTERMLNPLSMKPKIRSYRGNVCQLAIVHRVELDRFAETRSSLLDGSDLLPSLENPRFKTEEQEDCNLVDALAAAISRVRISEPKRSRICGSPSPIQQECTSNMKTNNLCAAF